MNRIIFLPGWARISIALLCAGIGLASSTVNGALLVRGLELTEPDASSRVILIASSVLMIVTELVAFFLVALLPAARLHQLRIIGVALWAFGVVTIFGTRLVLNHNADAAIAAHDMQVDNLKAVIASRSADAGRVRANGERQNASDNAWTRHLGTLAIARADAMERDIEPLREELVSLQAQQRTTLPRVLGPELALAQSIAMPVLISTIGLTLFGVSGMMLRRRDDEPEPVAVTPIKSPDPLPGTVTPSVGTVEPSVTGVYPVHTAHRTAVPAGAVPAVPQASNPMTAWRSIAVAVPLSAMSVSPQAVAAPAAQEVQVEAGTHSEEPAEMPPAVQQPVEPVQADEVIREQSVQPEQIEVQHEPAVTEAVTAPVTGMQDDCYQRLRVGVLDGQIKPSVRALREAGGVGTDKARRYLQQLAAEGLIAKEGQGYTLAQHPPGHTKDLFV